MQIVDDAGKVVRAGEIGNCRLRVITYFPDIGRCLRKLLKISSDGFFNTGDKAVINNQGYISIVGRSKDMIISGGLNIYPREIELVIDQIPG